MLISASMMSSPLSSRPVMAGQSPFIAAVPSLAVYVAAFASPLPLPAFFLFLFAAFFDDIARAADRVRADAFNQTKNGLQQSAGNGRGGGREARPSAANAILVR